MSPGALCEALAMADAAANVREAAAALRLRFAPLRVVVVDAADMRDETPAAVGRQRELFLGASDGHCWHVTTDPSVAACLYLTDRS